MTRTGLRTLRKPVNPPRREAAKPRPGLPPLQALSLLHLPWQSRRQRSENFKAENDRGHPGRGGHGTLGWSAPPSPPVPTGALPLCSNLGSRCPGQNSEWHTQHCEPNKGQSKQHFPEAWRQADCGPQKPHIHTLSDEAQLHQGGTQHGPHTRMCPKYRLTKPKEAACDFADEKEKETSSKEVLRC